MSTPLAAHVLHRLAFIASTVTPPALGGSGGATAPPAAAPLVAHVDPLVAGALVVAVGVVYAGIILAAVCVICWPRRLRWPAGVFGTAREALSTTRPAGSHRPLLAHHAAGAHPPTSIPVHHATPSARQTPTHRSHEHEDVATPALHNLEAWPPIEREVAGVGMVRWDGKTVRTFAGQPEVLQRLAFQRWRVQEGRCSEFAAPGAMPRGPGGEPRASSGGQSAPTPNESAQRVHNPRQPRSRPSPPPAGHPTRVAQPTGGGAGPA